MYCFAINNQKSAISVFQFEKGDIYLSLLDFCSETIEDGTSLEELRQLEKPKEYFEFASWEIASEESGCYEISYKGRKYRSTLLFCIFESLPSYFVYYDRSLLFPTDCKVWNRKWIPCKDQVDIFDLECDPSLKIYFDTEGWDLEKTLYFSVN